MARRNRINPDGTRTLRVYFMRGEWEMLCKEAEAMPTVPETLLVTAAMLYLRDNLTTRNPFEPAKVYVDAFGNPADAVGEE